MSLVEVHQRHVCFGTTHLPPRHSGPQRLCVRGQGVDQSGRALQRLAVGSATVMGVVQEHHELRAEVEPGMAQLLAIARAVSNQHALARDLLEGRGHARLLMNQQFQMANGGVAWAKNAKFLLAKIH